MRGEVHNGWVVEFRKNVHMYCHSLRMTKGGRRYEVPCEDSPLSAGLVAMWPYELQLDEAMFRDLLNGLRAWANSSGLKYRLYKSRNDYETNEREVSDPP
jgi:hypothetical protein